MNIKCRPTILGDSNNSEYTIPLEQCRVCCRSVPCRSRQRQLKQAKCLLALPRVRTRSLHFAIADPPRDPNFPGTCPPTDACFTSSNLARPSPRPSRARLPSWPYTLPPKHARSESAQMFGMAQRRPFGRLMCSRPPNPAPMPAPGISKSRFSGARWPGTSGSLSHPLVLSLCQGVHTLDHSCEG
jgi:hypothetical protein